MSSPLLLQPEQFQKATDCTVAAAACWAPVINEAMTEFGINAEPIVVAGFLAQMGQESGSFSRFEENLNYSAQGLANTWPNRYAVDPRATPKVPNNLALTLHRKPQAIANTTYANRGGNGNYDSGDGWLYRGRGPKQITFHDNYTHLGLKLGLNLAAQPDLLLIPKHGARAAAAYWVSAKCTEPMLRGDFKTVTIRINGGLIGYEDGNTQGHDDRVERLALAKSVLGLQ